MGKPLELAPMQYIYHNNGTWYLRYLLNNISNYLLILFLDFTMGGATDVWAEIESDGKYLPNAIIGPTYFMYHSLIVPSP